MYPILPIDMPDPQGKIEHMFVSCRIVTNLFRLHFWAEFAIREAGLQEVQRRGRGGRIRVAGEGGAAKSQHSGVR